MAAEGCMRRGYSEAVSALRALERNQVGSFQRDELQGALGWEGSGNEIGD